MSCIDCFKNCGDNYTSDRCVEYTGDDIPALGICSGDTLSKVEQVIVESLLTALNGTGIKPTDVTLENCTWLKDQFVGKDNNLVNLLQLLIDSQCTLKTMVDSLVEPPVVFDVVCLTGLPANPSATDILQSAVRLLCQQQSTISNFPYTYVKVDDLNALVLQIIANNPQAAKIPKYIPMAYIGPLSNFDNTGKGLGEYAGWYMMNGLNGTQDWRGRKVVGAVRNVPGGTLDNIVDPSIQGSNVNYAIGDKFGKPFVALSSQENGPHTHSISDPGHTHNLTNGNYVGNDGRGTSISNSGSDVFNWAGGRQNINVISDNTTGITIGSSGSGTAHENRDPSVAAVWIVQL